jgi:hypothetical protein
MKTKREIKKAEKKIHKAIMIIGELSSLGYTGYDSAKAMEHLNEMAREITRDLASRA